MHGNVQPYMHLKIAHAPHSHDSHDSESTVADESLHRKSDATLQNLVIGELKTADQTTHTLKLVKALCR